MTEEIAKPPQTVVRVRCLTGMVYLCGTPYGLIQFFKLLKADGYLDLSQAMPPALVPWHAIGGVELVTPDELKAIEAANILATSQTQGRA